MTQNENGKWEKWADAESASGEMFTTENWYWKERVKLQKVARGDRFSAESDL
jgi:hypothetical protein